MYEKQLKEIHDAWMYEKSWSLLKVKDYKEGGE